MSELSPGRGSGSVCRIKIQVRAAPGVKFSPSSTGTIRQLARQQHAQKIRGGNAANPPPNTIVVVALIRFL